MNFVQKYKLYRKVCKEITVSKVRPCYTTMTTGDKYSMQTDTYHITSVAYDTAPDSESYITTIKDRASNQTVEFAGNRAAVLYLKLFECAFAIKSR